MKKYMSTLDPVQAFLARGEVDDHEPRGNNPFDKSSPAKVSTKDDKRMSRFGGVRYHQRKDDVAEGPGSQNSTIEYACARPPEIGVIAHSQESQIAALDRSYIRRRRVAGGLSSLAPRRESMRSRAFIARVRAAVRAYQENIRDTAKELSRIKTISRNGGTEGRPVRKIVVNEPLVWHYEKSRGADRSRPRKLSVEGLSGRAILSASAEQDQKIDGAKALTTPASVVRRVSFHREPGLTIKKHLASFDEVTFDSFDPQHRKDGTNTASTTKESPTQIRTSALERNRRREIRRPVGRKTSTIASQALQLPSSRASTLSIRQVRALKVRKLKLKPPISIRKIIPKDDLSTDPRKSHDELDSVLEKFQRSSDTRRSHEEIDSVLESFSLSAKPNPEALTSNDLSSRRTSASPRNQARVVRHLSKTYFTAAFGYIQRRSASTLTSQDQNSSHADPPTVCPKASPSSPNADESIRGHLLLWKSKQDVGTRAAPLVIPGSQRWSGGAMNTITQSSGDDEKHAAIVPDEDLDIESQIYTNPEDSVLEIMNPHVFLKRGDLVDVKVGGAHNLGVFIREINNLAQIYTERGTWFQTSSKTVRLSIPGIFSPDELSDMFPYLPPTEAASEGKGGDQLMGSNVPRHIGGRFIERMVQFRKASDAVFRKHADRINRAYEILSQKTSQYLISLEDAALKVLQKRRALDLTPPMLLLIHRTLSNSQNILIDWRVHRLNPTFEILPRKTLARLVDTRDWTRRYLEDVVDDATESLLSDGSLPTTVSDNPLATFAEKARKVIQFNRRNRPLSSVGSIGPSLAKVELNESNSATWRASDERQQYFNEDEQKIISYLDAWVASRQLNKISNFESVGPMILRAVGMYKEMWLGASTAFTMLQELGIIKPWERPNLFKTGLGLPSHDPHHPTTVLRNQAHHSLSRLALEDSMARFRKDWGDLPVFCIDMS